MNREIIISMDFDTNQIRVSNDENYTPWDDLGILLEGMSLLLNIVIKSGYTVHKGQPLDEYIKSYIDKACSDIQVTHD